MTNAIAEEEIPLLESNERAVKRTPLPTLQLTIVLLVFFCNPLALNSIYPYINKFITELGITGGDDRRLGYYTGLIDSLFYAAEALTVLQWGRISDRIGCKPVLLIGLAGTALSIVCFGLSRAFWMLVISRCLCGLLNGNLGILKSVIGQLTDSTNRADGFSYIPFAEAISITIAPIIGGSLSHPHERFPTVFTSAFWKEFPYFLPCFVIAIFIFLSILITFVFFTETLPRHPRHRASQLFSDSDIHIPDRKPISFRQLLTYRVFLSISNYFCIAIIDIALWSLLPLFMTTPVEFGGLGSSPAAIGYVLSAFGASIGIFQIAFFSKLVRRFGEKRIFITGILTTAISTLLFPVISAITRKHGVTWVTWCLLGFSLLLQGVMSMSYSCIAVYINASAPSKSSLGATNGLSQTVISVARAMGPGPATSLFALSLQKNLLGGSAVYALLFVLSCISLFFAARLPPQVWDDND